MERMNAVLADIDAINAQDPVLEHDPASGTEQPRALLYGRRMSERLQAYRPDAGELVSIAVRGQHIRRWAIPRDDYPRDRAGYHRWRRRLGEYHGELVGELMARHGYDDTGIQHVAAMLRKEALRRDPDTQVMEDVAAQVFLLHYLQPFVDEQGEQHGEAKLQRIIRKTWGKMSPEGQAAALALPIPEAVRPVVEGALAGSE